MTAAMEHRENRVRPKMSTRRALPVAMIVLLVMVVLATMVVGLVWFVHHAEHCDLEVLQNEKLEALEGRDGEYDPQSIVLCNTSKPIAKELAERLGASLRITDNGNFATLTLPEGITIRDVYASEEYLRDLPRMEADFVARVSDFEDDDPQDDERLPSRPQYMVTDASYELQTYLDYLNMRNVWNRTRGSGVTVAVIDTGIDTDHPEFTGRISEYSYNATENKIVKDYTLEDGSYNWALIEDEQGHGTSVAGVIGASMNNGKIVGVAPEVTLLVIKAECDENGVFRRTSDLVFGLYYAVERDVAVVNMSFGAYDFLNPFAEATQLAVDNDIVCVAAAGNDATAQLCYPAADENVIGVGAMDVDSWRLADYSNYGENVDIVAPGTTYTTQKGSQYDVTSGTSLASPIVAGVLALYMSENRYQEFRVIEELLYASCYDLGDLGADWYYGYGAIDVSALMLEERGTITFNMMTDELENTEQVFVRNHTLQRIPEPERLYAVFDGWYYDPQCTEEYNWYADKFSSDLTLYANWVNEEDGIPYTYVELEDGTIEIRSYTGRRKFITIPDSIEGKIVSSIGEEAFAGENYLRQVTLPKYLVRIRARAFAGCSNLVSISIPDTVTQIEENAFQDNIRLSTVAFGSNSALQSIGDFAFSGCGKFRTFSIPKNVTALNGSAFFGTTSMQSFEVQSGNSAFQSVNGVLLNATGNKLVSYPAGKIQAHTYTVPNGIDQIGDYAFGYTKLKSVDLSSVNSIGMYAFANSQIESVRIPDGVQRMGTGTFLASFYLKEVTLGSGLTQIEGKTFESCGSLQKIHVPANIQIMGSNAFKNCSALAEVTFAENSKLVHIGNSAFEGGSLTEIHIPSSVIQIGNAAFKGTYSLRSIMFDEDSSLQIIGDFAFSKNGSLTSIQFPEDLRIIGSFAFEDTGLTTVTVPASVETLGEGAFAACHALTEILIENSNVHYVDVNGVVYDRSMITLVAYPAGNHMTTYTVPNGVVAIGENAFHGAWNLSTVALPVSLNTIRAYAFYDDVNLSYMNIPDDVMQIGNYAFAGDWSLLTVSFGENSKLPRIGYAAFANCGLTSFRVPASVSTMAQKAFEGCDNLNSITFAPNSKLASISAYMFDGCSNLQSISFEQGSALTSIQAHGLEGMANLTSIDFGDAAITNIDNFAFRFCESLTSFTVPEGVTNLGRYAFYQCSNLSSVTIPKTIEHIGRFAFLGTKNLNVYCIFQSGNPPGLS